MDDARLLERMMGNLRAFYSLPPEGGHVVELPGVLAAVCPAVPERSVFNGVVYERADALAAALDSLAIAYREAGVHAWTVWVPEGDAAARSLLEAAGHALDANPAAMVAELGSLSLRPEEDRFEGTLAEVAEVNDRAYEYDGAPFARALRGVAPGDLHLYVARVDGRPAASVAAYDADGDCGIYLVATIPEARGRGLASRLMTRALLDGRERGCTTTSLQATRRGEPIYEAIGYRSLGAIEMWERRS